MRKVIAHIIGLPIALFFWLLALLPQAYIFVVAYIAGIKRKP
jgi:hypothetical protein